jgi:hypothetical protein
MERREGRPPRAQGAERYAVTTLSVLMVAHSRTLFATHHIQLPAAKVTPEQVRRAINEWVTKTFEREWRIVASGLPEGLVPHGATDPFEPDEDDPQDPLHDLPPLSPPQFIRGLCAAKSCTYLAFIHPYCAACCRDKFQLEVKRTTRQDQSGLGLFATKRLTGRDSSRHELLQMHQASPLEYFINICTLFEIIDRKECTAPA